MRDAGCVDHDGVDALVQYAQGDARRVLSGLEAVLKHIHAARIPHPASRDVVVSVLEKPLPSYDKCGEQHFNLISALHKAVRGSDVEGSLYWLARMLAGGGERPLLRRAPGPSGAWGRGLPCPRSPGRTP